MAIRVAAIVDAGCRRGGRWLTVVPLLVVMLAMAVLAPVAVAQSADGRFDDVGESHWAAEVISAMASEGLLAGTECSEGLFCPDEPATRWVVAVWLVRAVDGVEPSAVSESRFEDVDPDEWWMPHVERLAELGITAGCTQEPLRYCPDETVTRARLASFLVRALDLEPAAAAGFVDTSGNTHEANIDALYTAGLTAGCKEEPLSYCPNTPASRAQMVTFLARILDLTSSPESAPSSCSNGTVVSDPESNSGLVSDCKRLMEARDTLESEGDDSLNWSYNLGITSWEGVALGGNPRRVTALRLASMGLTGSIPSQLGSLSNLTILNLYGNGLTGTIPPELGSVSSLKRLYLNANQLTGTIPPGLATLPTLNVLSLGGNDLTGTIPSTWTTPELTNLNLGENRLSGNIPTHLGLLASLTRLRLNGNELSGDIPAELGSLANLEHLRLSGNSLTGCIPEALSDVSDNDLERTGLPDCPTPPDG